MDIKEIAQQILNRTNGGRDIILQLFPQAKEKKHFKMNEERTASSNMFRMPDGNYIIKNWSKGWSKNAIQLFADENGLEYAQAVFQLAERFNITVQPTTSPAPKIRKIDQAEWDRDVDLENGFAYETKEFTDFELKTLGPFVRAETCVDYRLFSVKWHATLKEGKITIVEATDTFPIFIFCFVNKGEKFYKLYQPKSTDKKWRFSWRGKKPADFIGGFDILNKEWNKRKAKEEESYSDDNAGEVVKAEKIDKVFLCSGERDAINMASLGYFVLWLNSETAKLSGEQFKQIMDCAEELYNIPDLDETGKREGHDLALQYLDIRTLWLPTWLRQRKDWRGNARKDLTDFFEINSLKSIKEIDKIIKTLIGKSYPMRFWDETTKKDGTKSYSINSVHTYNFLYRNGFAMLNSGNGNNTNNKLVYVNKSVVKEVEPEKAISFIYNFLEKRNIPVAIRNMAYDSPRLNSSNVGRLPEVNLDFTDYSKTAQIFFFSDQNWLITKDKIISSNVNMAGRYCWDKNIINNRISSEYDVDFVTESFKVEDDYFNISKKENGYDIEIKETGCDFLNFAIQTSRIYWNDELSLIENPAEKIKYLNENLFQIASGNLTEEQQFEQKNHLVNKIYAIGYLMHKYKYPGRSWAIYAMENGMLDDDQSEGGSGKSIFLKSFSALMEYNVQSARNPKMWDNSFMFDGVTENTGYVLFDDADKNFKIQNLYSMITGPLSVNPKNNKPFTIPFKDSPKYTISSNYSLRNTDGSTMRRLLFIAFSDYYHEANNIHDKKRDPFDDFGHSLFTDWGVDQWNKYVNFVAQCIKFYLSVDEKINPPMNDLMMRNLQSFIGSTFMEWADIYLANNLNVEFNKKEALENLRTNKRVMENISSTNFMRKVDAWCKFNGYNLMPNHKTDAGGRIQRKNSEGKYEDFLFIENLEIPTEEPIEYELKFNKKNKDLPF